MKNYDFRILSSRLQRRKLLIKTLEKFYTESLIRLLAFTIALINLDRTILVYTWIRSKMRNESPRSKGEHSTQIRLYHNRFCIRSNSSTISLTEGWHESVPSDLVTDINE